MRRRPTRCYRQIKKKSYLNFQCSHGVLDPKIRICDVGMKKKEFMKSFLCSFGKLAKENVSSEALDATHITCNKKFVCKDAVHLRVGVHLLHVLAINKMLSYVGADRLQTGMRGVFGKPKSVCVRVIIG
ncbi:hypothetical protein R6Q59_006510 [Mikania micrantha]